MSTCTDWCLLRRYCLIDTLGVKGILNSGTAFTTEIRFKGWLHSLQPYCIPLTVFYVFSLIKTENGSETPGY